MKPANRWHAGYTIVETMIFLVISMILLIGAVGLFNGRIQRTQFSQTVQALDQQIRGVANESSTGTYPSSPSFDCDVPTGGVPNITNGSGQQGSRTNCVFAGKIIAPGASCTAPIATSTCTKLDVYTVVGRNKASANQVSMGLTGNSGAKLRVVTGTGIPDITQHTSLAYGTEITGIYLKSAAGGNYTNLQSGIGFFQSFNANYQTNGNLASGAQNIQTWVVKATTAGGPSPISNQDMYDAIVAEDISQPPANNVVMCLRSGSHNEKASITLGESNGAITTNVVIGDNSCP